MTDAKQSPFTSTRGEWGSLRDPSSAPISTSMAPVDSKQVWEHMGDLGFIRRDRVYSNGRLGWRWGRYVYYGQGSLAQLKGHYRTFADARDIAEGKYLSRLT